MRVDPRILLRRRQVAEQLARSRVRRSLVVLMALAGVGGVAWFLTSSLVSVRSVVVEGATNAEVDAILARHKIVEGRPMVAIRVESVEEGLMADPWIRSAYVKLVFPTEVEVYVQERVDVAWIWLEDRWGLLADDGVMIEYADTPTPIRSLIRIPIDDPGIGGSVGNAEVLGALRFLDALPDDLSERSIVNGIDGELWVSVRFRTVRLGFPVEMESKAASLVAVMDSAPDGVIDVTAPARPAIRTWDTIGASVKDRFDL